MKNEITKRVNGREYQIGYACMLKPCHVREKGRVFKMLRVHETEDIHFFEKIGDSWIMIPDYSFINLNGNRQLLKAYEDLPRLDKIEFDTFVRLVFYSLYSETNLAN